MAPSGAQFWEGVLANMSPNAFAAFFFRFGWALPLWGLMQALLGYHFETIAQARAVARAQALAYDAQLQDAALPDQPAFPVQHA